jgi:hypothetical protein
MSSEKPSATTAEGFFGMLGANVAQYFRSRTLRPSRPLVAAANGQSGDILVFLWLGGTAGDLTPAGK